MRIVYAVVTALCGAGATGYHAWADRHVDQDEPRGHVRFERRETFERASDSHGFDRGRDACRVAETYRPREYRRETVRRDDCAPQRTYCPPQRDHCGR